MIYEKVEIKLDYSKIDAPDCGHIARLDVFVPSEVDEVTQYNSKRPTVLILPGGGYNFTSAREADPIAMSFAAKGMNACVLYYSVAPAPFPVAMLEAFSAVKYIRENSKKWFVDDEKLYVCGFSAGGHLAACVGTLWDKQPATDYFGKTDIIRPDGLILCYPVIAPDGFLKETALGGTYKNLLGERIADNQICELLSLDKQVSATTPPAFIWSTFEDTLVPCENSLLFAAAMRKHDVPFELHIYEKGWHGIATGDLTTNKESFRAQRWLEEAAAWIWDSRSELKHELL